MPAMAEIQTDSGAQESDLGGAASVAEDVGRADVWSSTLGQENNNAKNRVYLVTISRALPQAAEEHNLRDLETVTRSHMSSMIRDVAQSPDLERGGRPRQGDACPLQKLVVFQEQHSDGSRHFHIALRIVRAMRFLAFKRTLQVKYGLCPHWSCSRAQ